MSMRQEPPSHDRETSAEPLSRNALVAAAQSLLARPWFEPAIVALIVINAAILGLQTDDGFVARYGVLADRIDTLILLVFVLELTIKIIAYGRRFFSSGWNWFDLIVVLISLAPATAGFSILRAARILRVLRLVSIVPKMRRVIGGFFAAIPGMAGVMGVLALIFYVSAVAATTVFGKATLGMLPEGATPEDLAAVRAMFGTLGDSFFTLFQLMTLENWADGIVVPTMRVFPNAMWFFIPFIVLTSFAVLNLFIGIIVDAMQDEQTAELEESRAADAKADAEASARIFNELQALKAEIAALRAERGAGGGV